MKSQLIGAFAVAVGMSAGLAHAVGVPGQGTWETTLQPRDLNGDRVTDAFYDTTLDVTWLRDANANGLQILPNAKAWAAGLDVYGVRGWRLPTMIDTGSPGCDRSWAGGTDCGSNVQTKSGDPTMYEPGQVVYSEMAHLYFVTLANKAWYEPETGVGPQPGWGLTNTGHFQDLQSYGYWSGLQFATSPTQAWFFETGYGIQSGNSKGRKFHAMAVHPGDVGAVPEPQTYAMLLLGLGAVMVAARRRPT